MNGQLLNATFVELTDTMVAGFDMIDFLHVLTNRSVQLLDVSAAGLLLADPGGELQVAAEGHPCSAQIVSRQPGTGGLTCASNRKWRQPEGGLVTTMLALAHAHAAPGFNADFYSVAATVIPVLFLAIAVQGTTYQDLIRAAISTPDRGELHPAHRLRPDHLALLSAGEVIAVFALAGRTVVWPPAGYPVAWERFVSPRSSS